MTDKIHIGDALIEGTFRYETCRARGARVHHHTDRRRPRRRSGFRRWVMPMANATMSVQNVHSTADSTTSVDTVTQSASSGPDGGFVMVAFSTVIVAAILMCVAYKFWIKPQPLIQVAAGYVPLAGVVAATAALERLLEPVSSFLNPPDTAAAAKTSAAQAQQDAADPAKSTQNVAPAVMRAATDQARLRADRVVLFWAIASICGVGISGGFGLFLVHSISSGNVSPYFDLVLTGLTIGAGTKPLHDLITGMQSK